MRISRRDEKGNSPFGDEIWWKEKTRHLPKSFSWRPSVCLLHDTVTTVWSFSLYWTNMKKYKNKTNKKRTKPLKSFLTHPIVQILFFPRRFFRRWSSVDFSTASYLAGKITIKKKLSCRQDIFQQLYNLLQTRYLYFISYKQEIFSFLHADCWLPQDI